MYVNGNAEELRHLFVKHEGKKQVALDFRPIPISELDMGDFAHAMAKEVQKHIIDPGLRDWMIPKFTTTTPNDVAVASVVMLAFLQAYFEFSMKGGCGFPSVTLLGNREDWKELVSKAERLPRYGLEAEEWSTLLIPALRRMLRSFDDPGSKETEDFWLRACYQAGVNGSGRIATLSGWITAFCFRGNTGKRLGGYADGDIRDAAEDSGLTLEERKPLTMDGVRYPMLNPESVPSALVTVPVRVEDYGNMLNYETTMIAGVVGMIVTEDRTTVQPISGWWMLVDQCNSL